MSALAAALKRSALSFRSEQRGSMAMLFAATVATIGLAIGSAVDYGSAAKVQSRMNGAADAASLAGAKLLSSGVRDPAKIRDEVTRNFDVNFAAETARGIKHDPLVVAMDPDSGAVSVKVTGRVPTAFMSIAGIDTMSIGSASTSQIDSDKIEVAMMLDVTGSMDWYTTDGQHKIAALRVSAKDLVDTLFSNVPANTDRVKIGLAPFASAVNAGVYAAQVSTSPKTSCVIERANTAAQASDMSGRASRMLPASFYGCPAAAVMPLSTDASAIKNQISKLSPGGSTAGHLGTAWASYLLSPKWADVFPAGRVGSAYNTGKVKKIAILMTDGQYNTVGESMGRDAQSNALALASCGEMKKNGVTVYTIGFAMTGMTGAKQVLQDCASEVDGKPAFYDAENAAALGAAYDDIANRILKIRVSS